MDVLNSLFTKAGELGLLQPLSWRNSGQRISLYADDAALFIRPVEDKMGLTMEILHNFGEASGLHCNLEKELRRSYQWTIARGNGVINAALYTCCFSLHLLGLLVSNKQFRKAELIALTERIGDKVPAWKASS